MLDVFDVTLRNFSIIIAYPETVQNFPCFYLSVIYSCNLLCYVMILLIYYIIQDVTWVLFWTCFSVRSVFILVTKSQHNNGDESLFELTLIQGT